MRVVRLEFFRDFVLNICLCLIKVLFYLSFSCGYFYFSFFINIFVLVFFFVGFINVFDLGVLFLVVLELFVLN